MWGWQKFSDTARHSILLGQNKAVAAGEVLVETEHLLFGLLQDESVALLLQQSQVPLDRLESQLEQLFVVQPGASLQIVGKDPKLSSGAKRVLECAAEEARTTKTPSNTIEPEHLLLALLRGKEDLPASYTLLANQGLKLETMRLQVRNKIQAANKKAA